MYTEKIRAMLALHSLGDILGFGRFASIKENYGGKDAPEVTDYIMSTFINDGGINTVDVHLWNCSGVTMMNLAVLKSLNKTTDVDGFKKELKYQMIDLLEDIYFEKRLYDSRVKSAIYYHKENPDKDLSYNSNDVGNSAAVRASTIGAMFNGKKNRDKLVQYAIASAKMTHNSAVGILSSVTVALFTAYILEKVGINIMPEKMLKFIKKRGKIVIDEMELFDRDKLAYFEVWENYIKMRIITDKGVIKRIRILDSFRERPRWFYDNFNHYRNITKPRVSGSTGEDSIIYAYDSLIDVYIFGRSSWETLVFKAMLHSGDSNSVGAIAGGLYGAFIGFNDTLLPKILKGLEKMDELSKETEILLDKIID